MTTIVRDWRELGPNESMPRGEVLVWSVSLDTGVASPVLSEDEVERARRYRFEADRRRFSACRAALRTILASYVRVAPRDVSLATMAGGKPCLDASRHEPALRFSVSHSSERALIALAVDREVGVDVEHVRAMAGMDGVIRRYFSARELEGLESLPDDERRRAFFRIWTVKEAYLKACGDGLTRRLAHIDVRLPAGAEPLRLLVHDRPGDEQRFILLGLDVGAPYAGALAVER